MSSLCCLYVVIIVSMSLLPSLYHSLKLQNWDCPQWVSNSRPSNYATGVLPTVLWKHSQKMKTAALLPTLVLDSIYISITYWLRISPNVSKNLKLWPKTWKFVQKLEKCVQNLLSLCRLYIVSMSSLCSLYCLYVVSKLSLCHLYVVYIVSMLYLSCLYVVSMSSLSMLYIAPISTSQSQTVVSMPSLCCLYVISM